MNIPLIGFAVFFAAFMGNRFIMTNAMKKLDDKTKLKFLDVFPRRNNYFTIILVAVILLYFGAIQFYPQHNIAITTSYLGIYIVYSIIKSILDYNRLKQIGTSVDYIKSYIFACFIFIVGILVVSGIYFFELWNVGRKGIY